MEQIEPHAERATPEAADKKIFPSDMRTSLILGNGGRLVEAGYSEAGIAGKWSAKVFCIGLPLLVWVG